MISETAEPQKGEVACQGHTAGLKPESPGKIGSLQGAGTQPQMFRFCPLTPSCPSLSVGLPLELGKPACPLDMPCSRDPPGGGGGADGVSSICLPDFLLISLPLDLSSPCPCVQRFLKATVALGLMFGAKTKRRGYRRPPLPFSSLLASGLHCALVTGDEEDTAS